MRTSVFAFPYGHAVHRLLNAVGSLPYSFVSQAHLLSARDRASCSGPCCESSSGSSALSVHFDYLLRTPGCPHSTCDVSLVELDVQILHLFALKSHAHRATERQCLNRKGETQSCWRSDDYRSNSLFHDLAVRVDRIAARQITIFIRDLQIAHFLNERTPSFQMSFTKRHHARLQYRRSNLLGRSPSPTLPVHKLNLRNLSLYPNRHICNFVSVLILRHLDVHVHLVDRLLGHRYIFSALSSS